VDFAETTETENGNTETETRKEKDRQYCIKNFKCIFFVPSWLGCYLLGRGETEFCSCTTRGAWKKRKLKAETDTETETDGGNGNTQAIIT